MKKKSIVISIILVAVLFVAAGHWLLTKDNPPLIPSYQFLADKEIKMVIKDYEFNSSCNATRHIYSFVGDFNDIYSSASNELCSLGYIKVNTGIGKTWTQSFHLPAKPSNGFTKVLIHERQKLNPRSTPDLVLYKFRDGWISVEVVQAKTKPRWRSFANQLLNRTRLKRAD